MRKNTWDNVEQKIRSVCREQWSERCQSNCLVWEKGTQDYPQISISGVQLRVHRVMYAVHKGPIPPHLVIDHLCRVTRCCNPDHLEAVDEAVNVGRGLTSCTGLREFKKTCKNGHPRAGPWDNYCKECARERNPDYVKPADRSKCPQGHDYSPENTYTPPNGRGRYCRVCMKAHKLRHKEKRTL